MSASFDRSSWFVRWGWIFAVGVMLGQIPNALAFMDDGKTYRLWLLPVTFAAVVYCLVLWRSAVRDDRELQATIARIRAGRGGES